MDTLLSDSPTPMNSILQRIRNQHSSKVESQKQTCGLLVAIEHSIQSTSNNSTHPSSTAGDAVVAPLTIDPLAYLGTLLSVIAHQKETQVIESAFYILAVIFPFCSASVLRLKFIDILEQFTLISGQHADNTPLMKSIITCYESLLIAQDSRAWQEQPKTCNTLLH